MEFRPILSAMSRNKFGAILIVAQIAITLAFLANALTLVAHRASWSARPTGIDEADTFVLRSSIEGHSDELDARQLTDLANLRALPGVIDAYVANSYPLQGGGSIEAVALLPKQANPSTTTTYYTGDEHALHTLGVTLVAGRNFTADEVQRRFDTDNAIPTTYIISKALADKLFPSGDALGKRIYVESSTQPAEVIGIIAVLQGSLTASGGYFSTISQNSVLGPYRMVQSRSTFVVRAEPGKRDVVLKAAEQALYALDSERILRSKTMAQVRLDAYRGDRGLIVLLSAVSSALLIVTGFGIVGLTSYWVAQRRQQIGIRRALGASKGAILRYFQTENLLIASAGAAVGVGLAIALNLWMVHSFEMVRIDNSRVLAGALTMLLLGQLAVLWPALRAASISPALATRGG